MADIIRWTVSVSKDTDVAVRSFLEQRGMKTDDFSAFIEEAVRWRVLDQTMAEARDAFTDIAPDELESMLSEAVAVVRREHLPNAE